MGEHRDGKKRFVFKSRVATKGSIRVGKSKNLRQEVGEIYGRHIISSIREEISKSYSLGRGIPRSKEFRDSFSFEVNDSGDVIVRSDWPWVKRYLKARGPIKMTWLTQSNPKMKGRKIIPLKQKDGTIRFRTLPLTTRKAWIHPAIERFTFIQRGVVKGKKRARAEVQRYLTRVK